MKKALSLLLILAMALSLLAGCGADPAPTPETPDTTPQTPAAPEAPAEPDAPAELVVPEWTEPVYNMEETLEVRQQALAATGLAYFYKGILNQYGLQDMNVIDEMAGGNLRGKTLERNTPEENTKDLTLYQWCSSYIYDVVYHTMGYKVNSSYERCRTAYLATGDIGNSDLMVHIFRHTGDDAKDGPAIDAIIADLRPGDVVTWVQSEAVGGGGHSLLVIPDITGDGKYEVLHRSGGRYDMKTGKDVKESYGIKRTDVDAFLSGNNGLYNRDNKVRLSVMRPTNLDPAKYPLTNAVKARLAWPGLRIDRTVDCGVMGAVVSGGELTYTLEIYNYGTEPIKGLPVMDKLDSHCTMVSQDGKPATTTFPVWNVDIAPNESVTLTYTVKVEGNPGELVVSEGGSVAGIPSNQLTTTICAAIPDAEKLQSEGAAAAAAAADGLDFVNRLYEAATGVNPGIVSMEELRTVLFDERKSGSLTLYTLKNDLSSPMGSMLIPTYVGGRLVLTGPNDRVLETRLEDLMPGDILIVDGVKQGKVTPFYWIYNGNKLVEWNNGKTKNITDSGLEKLLSYNFFIALRPSLVK